MSVKIFDNFLSEEDHKNLCESFIFNENFSLYLHNTVTYTGSEVDELWDWYGTHTFYLLDRPSETYEKIKNVLVKKVMEVTNTKTLIRARLNFYPHTETLREHYGHTDSDFSHVAGIYCLNTCDGFTRVDDGTIIESVANRFYTFNGGKQHNSTTTTNSKGRYNINFNLI